MPRGPPPDDIEQELSLLIAAADDPSDSELPGPATAREKCTSPDDNQDEDSCQEHGFFTLFKTFTFIPFSFI